MSEQIFSEPFENYLSYAYVRTVERIIQYRMEIVNFWNISIFQKYGKEEEALEEGGRKMRL